MGYKLRLAIEDARRQNGRDRPEKSPATSEKEAGKTSEQDDIELRGVVRFDVKLDEETQSPVAHFELPVPAGVTDLGRRKALSKIIEDLKQDVADFEKAGLNDQAAKERDAIRLLETALHGRRQQATIKYRPRNGEASARLLPRERVQSALDHARVIEEIDGLVKQLNARGALNDLVAKKDQLIAAGRHDEAEKLEAEILIRNREITAMELARPSAPPSLPPSDLHRTLTELREQVQELRKEVGQVRALLEKK